MRRILLPALVCMGLPAPGYQGPPPLTEHDERAPIRMGGEMLLGYRTQYFYRGEKLAADSTEFQLAGALALSDDWAVSGEAFALRAFPTGNMSQYLLCGEVQYYLQDECTLGAFVTGQSFRSCELKGGVEPGVSLIWNPSSSWSWKASCLYDSGQSGFYADFSGTWQPLICNGLVWENMVHVGVSQDYLGNTGVKDLMFRTGVLWQIDGGLRSEPFLGWYRGFGKREISRLVGGLWISYSF